jgi:hypothetical protein
MVRSEVWPPPCPVNGLVVPTSDLVPLAGNGSFRPRANLRRLPSPP